MHVFLYPQKDTTIYSNTTTQNTGKDEILEVLNYFSTGSLLSSPAYSRILLDFDLSWISSSINSGDIFADKIYLNMFVCNASELLNDSEQLYIYPITGSWVEGIGKKLSSTISTNGASWIYTDGEITSSWNQSGSDYISSSQYEVTASLWENENTFQSSGNYIYELADMRTDVTDIVHGWLSGSIEENGFLIKRSDEYELDEKEHGMLQFYSMNSHTVYIPKLEFVWDDSLYHTGSLTEISSSDMFVFVKQLQEQYNNRSKPTIRVGARKLYPTKSYTTSNPYSIVNYLPSSSYYSVIDAATENTIIPFDDYSKLSCDENGNYFNLRLDGLFPERFYKIKIKVVSGSIENIYDQNYTFKVVR